MTRWRKRGGRDATREIRQDAAVAAWLAAERLLAARAETLTHDEVQRFREMTRADVEERARRVEKRLAEIAKETGAAKAPSGSEADDWLLLPSVMDEIAAELLGQCGSSRSGLDWARRMATHAAIEAPDFGILAEPQRES